MGSIHGGGPLHICAMCSLWPGLLSATPIPTPPQVEPKIAKRGEELFRQSEAAQSCGILTTL